MIRNKNGLSLIELMVSFSILAMVMAPLYALYRDVDTQRATSAAEINGTAIAMHFIDNVAASSEAFFANEGKVLITDAIEPDPKDETTNLEALSPTVRDKILFLPVPIHTRLFYSFRRAGSSVPGKNAYMLEVIVEYEKSGIPHTLRFGRFFHARS